MSIRTISGLVYADSEGDALARFADLADSEGFALVSDGIHAERVSASAWKVSGYAYGRGGRAVLPVIGRF